MIPVDGDDILLHDSTITRSHSTDSNFIFLIFLQPNLAEPAAEEQKKIDIKQRHT